MINKIWSIYFSATLTTKKVVNTIANELSSKFNIKFAEYDFTTPKMRNSFPEISRDDLVVFGMPTYAGRLPNLMLKYLDTVNGDGAMAIPVVTFGNREFDNSLIELRNILESHDFHTVAACACACEHSFSYELGAGRPDFDDLYEIRDFADRVYDKLTALKAESIHMIQVPGDANAGYFQPRDRSGKPIDIRKVKPLTDLSKCTHCGACARICPMGAISPENPSEVSGICIKCGACFKRCTKHAKYFDDKGYLYHKSELEYLYGGDRHPNQFFL